MTDNILFEEFKSDWLNEIANNNLTSVEKGNTFSKKLVMQWLDFNEDTDDIIFCDGSGDGGIDIAYLQRGDSSEENSNEGDTWYLIQSKYGSAFAGKDTLLVEAQKVIETIDGHTKRLSSLTSDLIERVQNFRNSASNKDKIVLVFATVDSLNDDEKRVLQDIKILGKTRLGDIFDTEAVSVETIHQRVVEHLSDFKKYTLPFTANLVASGNDLLVGSIKLNNLYQFLKDYKNETGDLDLIYEKNVRKFLGARKKVNAGIAETIKNNPERFGLYNNGITIVVEDFKQVENDKFELSEPYIVNGCQTTKTVWETLYKKLDSGGTGFNAELEEWKERLKRGIVVVKIVKVGENGEELLTNTTRYTNSQNAVGQKDFISLENNFRTLAREMAVKHNIFLEIQRGGWDSQKTFQRTTHNAINFNDWINAFDLLKVYGAGWLFEPGIAFSKNPPFAPGGSIFKRITENPDFDFGVEDLYSCYLLTKLSQKIKFGRGSDKQSRSLTKYLFFYILTELLKDCMLLSNIEIKNTNLSNSIIKIFKDNESEAAIQLTDASLNVVDDYLTNGNEDSIYTEPNFKNDVANFLKWEKLGKGSEFTPKLTFQIEFTKRVLKKNVTGQPKTVRDIICEALK